MVQFDAERLGDYQRMARTLRAAGIGVEVFPEAKKIGQQLQYAEKRGFRVALIAGPDEFAQGVWKIKDLARARGGRRRRETEVARRRCVSCWVGLTGRGKPCHGPRQPLRSGL